MTFKEMNQLYYLNREIENDKRKLNQLRNLLTSPYGSKPLTFPKNIPKENKTVNYITEISDLENVINAKIKRCLQERVRLEEYIAQIPDSLTRQIFTYRFINGLSFTQISIMIGGGNSAAGVRKRVERYFNRENLS